MTRRRVFALSLLVLACTACASARAEPAAPSPLERQILALADRMEELHPNLFAAVPRERFRADAERLARSASDLSRAELVVGLMRLTALGERNGHTGIFIFHPHARPLHVYPLKLYLFADGLHVVDAPDASLLGARLEAVEGVAVDRIVEAVKPLIPHDNDSGRSLLLPEYVVTEEVLAGLGLTDGGRAVLTFAGGRTATLEPVPTGSYPQGSVVHPLRRPGAWQPLWLRFPERDQWLTTIDRGRAVYFAYRETDAPRGDLTDRLLRLARRKSTRRVVVDVRLNGGGDNTTYWPLIQVLRRPAIGNKTVVLLGRKTFSAAGNFVAELDHETRVRFVGEPSGGSPNQWGDSAPVDVPAAGLTVHVAVQDVVAVPGDKRLAVMPDVPVELAAADFFAGRDPVLERALAPPRALAAAPRPAGTWAGTFSFTAAGDPVGISIELRGSRATVSLGKAHPAKTEVAARAAPGRLRLSLPGRPSPVLLDVRLRGTRLVGTIRQGSARGTVSLRRGRPLEGGTAGLYTFADGSVAGIMDGFNGRAAVLFERDEIRGLYPTGHGRYAVGSGLATRAPAVGTASFTGDRLTWLGETAELIPLRQEEVHVGVLSCTLTIPPGEGRRPAIAFAHGAGPAPRAWTGNLTLFFNRLGIVTLACDKRGVAQSGGRYPGEFPSSSAVDQYARDVQAQARFLAAQPEVDPAKVGLSGGSQAGWIMPLAASREPAVRFVIGLVAPTLTVDETDLWADLSGNGFALPTMTDAEIEARVRAAGPSGFDPRPSIRALRIPALWLFGAKDRVVPSRLCVEWLDPVTREAGRDFSYVVFPSGGHALVDTPNGLGPEAALSHRFVPGFHATIREWLRARGLAS